MLRNTILNKENLYKLTSRERVVLRCLLQNPYATNEEIGSILGKAERTIENQLRSVYKRLLPKAVDDNTKRLAIIRELTLDDLA